MTCPTFCGFPYVHPSRQSRSVGCLHRRSALRARLSTVRVFDTTLRDGLAAFSKSLSVSRQLEIADLLAKAGVHVLEAGYPSVIPESAEVLQRIASSIGRGTDAPIICALARMRENDINIALDTVRSASQPRVNLFASASAPKGKRDEVLRTVADGVKYASKRCEDVQFTVANALTADLRFVVDLCKQAEANGAKTVSLADTGGQGSEEKVENVVREVCRAVQSVVGVHMHNATGRAVKNTLQGIKAGGGQVECTVDGWGDGGGNACLQQVVKELGFGEKEELQRVSEILGQMSQCL